MAKKKTEPRKKLEPQEARVIDRYHTVWTAEKYYGKKCRPGTPDVPGTVTVTAGVTENGTPWEASAFMPDRTPEQQKAWEKTVADAFGDLLRSYVDTVGLETAKERLGIKD